MIIKLSRVTCVKDEKIQMNPTPIRKTGIYSICVKLKKSYITMLRYLDKAQLSHLNRVNTVFNSSKPSLIFMGHKQTVKNQNVVSDQVLHCLLTEFATYHPTTLKLQIASSIDKGGKFH